MPALVVVETEDDAYLGTVERVDGYLIIRNGYVGHPRYVPAQDVERVTRAENHPDVVHT